MKFLTNNEIKANVTRTNSFTFRFTASVNLLDIGLSLP